MIKWVLRGGRGVDTDPEVGVRFPSVVMEVVGLWGQRRAGYRSEREARRDECRPMIQQYGLLVSLVCVGAFVVPLNGDRDALENMCPGLGRDHVEGTRIYSRWWGGDHMLVCMWVCPL